MITIIDYGLGNLTSVKNALVKLGVKNQITNKISVLEKSDALILPGVGAADVAMKNLKDQKIDKVILEHVKKGKPILGLCLGMQLLLSFSEEGNVRCLDIIPGIVKKFNIELKIPQIGWNNVKITNNKSSITNNISNNSYFYFVHSYYCSPDDKKVIIGTTQYGIKFASVIQKDNIFGAQFHPEKSDNVGLQLLRNFSEFIC